MPTLHLVDGSGYLFRAYHALPPLTTSKGVPTGAVRGVASMLLKDLREHNPTHIAVCMDLDRKGKRTEIYKEYKANRPPPPDDLIPQFSLVRDVMRAMNLPVLELEGYEADDLIATLAREATDRGWEVVIVSGDKDLMQLVCDGKVKFYDGMKDAWFDETAVKAKWGVDACRVGDLLALVGDSVDNVPGVPGVGEKTAASLLNEYGSLDAVLAAAPTIKKPKLSQNLVQFADQVRLSKQLVNLDDRVDMGVTLEDLARKPIDPLVARNLFSELEMFTLLKDLPQPAAKASRVQATIVRDEAALDALVAKLQDSERFAFRLVMTGSRPLADAIIGLGIGVGGEASYIPVGFGGLGQASLPEAKVLAKLKPLLEAERPLKDGHALKNAATTLLKRGVRLAGVGIDVELTSFLTNAARKEHNLEDLAREKLGEELPLPPLDSRKRPMLASALPDEVAPYAGAGADAIARLSPMLGEDLEKEAQAKLYETIERPLIGVLATMEVAGILVDAKALREQADEFEKEIAKQLTEIEQLAGGPFNVNAPAQLAEVLFERLQLPVLKRGKTGPSTDHEVLEKLAEQHPLPAKVLEYRSISKLKNTYLDTLPELVAEDGRIHTTFNMVGAATGRLSSNDPNLQNIPIRTDLGKRIRAAFVAPPGSKLVSADYSQIELRILAHVSGDKALRESFAKGEDVHTRTASEIYEVMPLMVTGEMRRVAKMINYAIAYGLSAFGLSTRIDIPGEEAKRVIAAYFARYAGVKAWLDGTIETGRAKGYVETILGRRRQLADLRSKNPQSRMAAERMAVNAPIQGTAADIVKKAMIDVDRVLAKEIPGAKMLLQVHDELLFEVPEDRADDLVKLVRPLMEGAVQLEVPLVVDVGVGRSWAEAH